MDEAPLQADACKTLRLLAVETNSRTRCLRDGAVRAIVAGMRGRPRDEALQVQACGALGAIAALERNRIPMAGEGAVDAILAAMSAHLDSPDVATHACRALGNITSAAVSSPAAGETTDMGWDSAAVVQARFDVALLSCWMILQLERELGGSCH